MRIGTTILDLSDPFSTDLFIQYIGEPREKLIYHENLLGDSELVVYFKPAEELVLVPVEIQAAELPNLLILEVVYFLYRINHPHRLTDKEQFYQFVNIWWQTNHLKFCRSFYPLTHDTKEHQQAIMVQIHALLTQGSPHAQALA